MIGFVINLFGDMLTTVFSNSLFGLVTSLFLFTIGLTIISALKKSVS